MMATRRCLLFFVFPLSISAPFFLLCHQKTLYASGRSEFVLLFDLVDSKYESISMLSSVAFLLMHKKYFIAVCRLRHCVPWQHRLVFASFVCLLFFFYYFFISLNSSKLCNKNKSNFDWYIYMYTVFSISLTASAFAFAERALSLVKEAEWSFQANSQNNNRHKNRIDCRWVLIKFSDVSTAFYSRFR